jgi:hypothetical protein
VHPWLPRVVSITRPALLPGLVAYGLWTLRALDGLGLDPSTRLHVYATLVNYVRGTAMSIETEAGVEMDTGMTSQQWIAARLPIDGQIVAQFTEPGRSSTWSRCSRTASNACWTACPLRSRPGSCVAAEHGHRSSRAGPGPRRPVAGGQDPERSPDATVSGAPGAAVQLASRRSAFCEAEPGSAV